MSQPQVTIVTIVKNIISAGRKKMFQQCIESVINQKYPFIDYLVVDGQSNDGTIKLLQTYQDKGMLRFISSPDTGIYDAMNKGIDNARGEYVAFLNSDDYYENDLAVSKSVEALTASHADFSYGTVNMVDKTRKLVFYPCEILFVCSMPFSHQSMFCRRDILAKYRFDTSFRLAGDIDLIMRLYLDGCTSVDARWVIAVYRMSGESSANQDKCYEEYTRVFQKNYSRFCHISMDTYNYMARSFQVPNPLMWAIIKHLRAKKSKMADQLDSLASFQSKGFSARVKSWISKMLKAILPDSFFEKARQRFLDFTDKDIPTTDKMLYFLNHIQIFRISRNRPEHPRSLFKLYILGIPIYKRKDYFMRQ